LKEWPALDVRGFEWADAILAFVDDFSPTAVDSYESAIRIFFSTTEQRNAAQSALQAAGFLTAAHEICDDDWARRSQEDLGPVTIGRVTVAPPWAPSHPQPATSTQPPATVIIQPSMGFGTGHHATTRLCLAALQEIDLVGASVLDLGTGSGVLAIAASLLGAAQAVGIDSDADAIDSARQNLALNPGAHGVTFAIGEIENLDRRQADLVTANLTSALLVRAAARLIGAVRPCGKLIVSGLLVDERRAVLDAFEGLRPIWEGREDEWVAVALHRSPNDAKRS